MKKLSSIVLVFSLFSLSVGCAVVRDSKDAAKMEKEGEGKIDELNQTNRTLTLVYGITLLPLSHAFSVKILADGFPWDKRTPAEINEIRELLTAQRARAGRIQEIVSHKNITWKGNPEDLSTVRTNAQYYLDSLQRYESGSKSPTPQVERQNR